MKFRAIVTQDFSFTDSSQNNPSPGAHQQLSRAQEAAVHPDDPSCHHPAPLPGAERSSSSWGRGSE